MLYTLVTVVLYVVIRAASAADFIATVDDNKISTGQTVQLTLQLEDAKPVTNLDISPLAKNFTIYSQQQFSSYTSVNGIIKSESGWHVLLLPKNSGELVIPPITLETDKGILHTKEIIISVQQTQPGSKNHQDQVGISLISTVSKAKAYVNESVVYSIKIIAYKPIANIVLEDIKSDNAIIEKIGEPKQYDQSLGGVRAHIIEIKYAITALKPGKINISPVTVHGELHEAMQQQRSQRFSIFNNLFLENTYQLKPFNLQSEEVIIDVAAAPLNSDTWLPANSLTLSQSWEKPQTIKVGDTITRKVKIVANGIFAKQLPSVKGFIDQDSAKVYANKPIFKDNIDADKNMIVGVREEEYSIIPQQSGSITFPEIRLKWWNLRTNKFEVSVLPAERIQVAAVAVDSSNNMTVDYSSDTPQIVNNISKSVEPNVNTTIWYTVVGVITGMLITIGMILIFLYVKKRKVRVAYRSKPSIVNNLVNIKTAVDLRANILQYAIKNWYAPKNITINSIPDVLNANKYNYDAELCSELLQKINAAIYANASVKIETLIADWLQFKSTVVKGKQEERSIQAEAYSTLNPT